MPGWALPPNLTKFHHSRPAAQWLHGQNQGLGLVLTHNYLMGPNMDQTITKTDGQNWPWFELNILRRSELNKGLFGLVSAASETHQDSDLPITIQPDPISRSLPRAIVCCFD